MSNISVKNGKLYVDDREFDISGVRQLSDDDLKAVGGGQSGTKLVVGYEYDGSLKYLQCAKCGCNSMWKPQAVVPRNMLLVKCRNCGENVSVEIKT